MPPKPWSEAVAPGGSTDPPKGGPSLLDLAAGNPDLLRLLEERDRLERRMQEIAAGSPGSFAPAHDNVRFPVEPLGQRRERDTRWAQAREESRSAAVQRILDARRRAADAGAAHARRKEESAAAAALDARLEQSRQEVLAERWRARAAGDDWYALRERQAAEALADARARTAEAAEREQALDRRISRARSDKPNLDWSEQRERRRVQALEMARRLTAEAAAAEQALDERVIRAREERLRENRLAQDPSRAPLWISPSSRGGIEPPPQESARRLPPTAAERSLDERLVRAGKHGPKRRDHASAASREPSHGLSPTAAERLPDERRSQERKAKPEPDRFGERWDRSSRFPAAPPLRDLDAPTRCGYGSRPTIGPGNAGCGFDDDARRCQSARTPPARERPRITGEETFERRRDRERDTLAEARKLERKVSDGLRAFGGDERAGRFDRLRGPMGKAGVAADKTRNDLKREAGAWQAARNRTAGFLGRSPRDLGGFDRANHRKLGMALGSVDDMTRLRDAARAARARKPVEAPRPHKPAQDDLEDLDGRRRQAIDKLKARRDHEKRDEQRRDRGLARLKARRDGLDAVGQAQ